MSGAAVRAITAMLMPRAMRIRVMAAPGHAAFDLTIDQARDLRAALGDALSIAAGEHPAQTGVYENRKGRC